MPESRSKLGLVADIGGTNARFALVDLDAGDAFALREQRRYLCRDFGNLKAAWEAYLADTGVAGIQNAAVSIAGPVDSDRVLMTNLRWEFSIRELQGFFGLRSLHFINDAAAGALATTCLAPDDLDSIKAGVEEASAPRVNLIPGTGFGVGAALPVGGVYLPVPGEGGHSSLAAASAEEFAVLRHIAAAKGRAIGDTVLSGPGMLNIYLALAAVRGATALDVDPPEMTRLALAGEDALCVEALDLYCLLFGRFAGDLALTLNAHGGVFISGNILQRLSAARISQKFVAGFTDRDLMAAKIARIPVWLVQHDSPGLLGAAVRLLSAA